MVGFLWCNPIVSQGALILFIDGETNVLTDSVACQGHTAKKG